MDAPGGTVSARPKSLYGRWMSIREASRVFGLHRDTVRKMLAHSVPPGYRRRKPPKPESTEGGCDGAEIEQEEAEGVMVRAAFGCKGRWQATNQPPAGVGRRSKSVRRRKGAQSGQGTTEPVPPGPVLGEMQSKTAR